MAVRPRGANYGYPVEIKSSVADRVMDRPLLMIGIGAMNERVFDTETKVRLHLY